MWTRILRDLGVPTDPIHVHPDRDDHKPTLHLVAEVWPLIPTKSERRLRRVGSLSAGGAIFCHFSERFPSCGVRQTSRSGRHDQS
jgi:hypothetical protein